jgi:hypothetical protein
MKIKVWKLKKLKWLGELALTLSVYGKSKTFQVLYGSIIVIRALKRRDKNK